MTDSPASTSAKPHKLVVCGWLARAGKILVTQRRKKGHLAAMWEFPGGKVDPEESMASALRRELREELGIAVVVGAEIARVEHDYDTFTVELVLFDVPYHEGELQHLEVDDAQWVSPDWFAHNQTTMPPADIPLVQAALQAHEESHSVNPYTGETFSAPRMHDAEALMALVTQLDGKTFARSSVPARSDALRRLAEGLRREAPWLARLATLEMGKPITEALAEVEKCAKSAEYVATHGQLWLAPQQLQAALSARTGEYTFEPLGCVLAVMPWNFPYWQIIRAALPSWLVGNVVVHKPAQLTSLCALALQVVIDDAFAKVSAVPFTTVLTNPAGIERLIAHDAVHAVTLTGSEKAGRSVAAQAGAALKKTVLELGGSDPVIVFADADLDAAVDQAVRTRFQNAGQSCIAGKRFLVARPIYAAFLEQFVVRVKELAAHVGDPLHEKTQLGPLASAAQHNAIEDQLKRSAQLVTVVWQGVAHAKSVAYFPPTVVSVLDRSAPVWSEETFGPIAALIAFDEEAEAIEWANDSRFGLAAAVFTKDAAKGARVAAQIACGSVTLNGMTISDPSFPFGGVRASGYGRELSDACVYEFSNIRTIVRA